MAPHPPDRRRRNRVLIVEDHEETRILYGKHFEHAGYEVETAPDGNEGIAAALRLTPDAIVVDLSMPKLDGWETVSLLRTYPATAGTPVIACTAVESEEARARAMALGCSAIVRKPCLPADIERVVRGLLAGGADPGEA